MRYDAALRMQQVTHAKGNVIHARTDYVFDQNGNRSKETINRNAAAQVTNYSYDKADRLTQTEVIDVNQTVTTAYTLDSVANRTKEIITTKPAGAGSASTVTKTYTYDGRNQLTAITDTAAGNTTLSYDSQGNLSQKTQGSDSTYYSYNARDNLISVRKNNTVLGNYSNNHLGLRVEKEAKDPLQPNAPPAIFRTLWNGRHAFQDSDLSGNTLSRYENDGRHTVSFWSSTDGSQALHHDALGSITATTDNSGQLKSETVYDAFGNIASRSGQSANKFGYTGHQMDQETGLIYFQARYYDPQTGRFITQDPYEGDWNTPLSLHHYLYAYGNPTTYIDLHGYQSISASIDKAAEGCGAWSCAGWALAKGAYSAATFGFAIVHDPVRDQYDEGKITGSQYVKRGIGGGTAMVGVNVASTMLGGLGGGGTTLATTMARGALTGGLISGGTDAATQGVNISAGLQESYDATRTAKTTAIGMGLGVVAPLIPAALKTEIGQAVTGAISSTVRKTREAVETAVQSVSSRMKGVVIQEAGTMGTAGAKITSKSVAATPTRHMSVGDEPYAGAHGVDDGGMAHPLKGIRNATGKNQQLPLDASPYQLELFPPDVYRRTVHYGNTPTAAQKALVPPGMEFDHDPMLVKHYFEGSGDGSLAGFNLTEAERKTFAARLDVGSAATPAQQRAQGAAAARYSKEQKKIWGLGQKKK